MGLFDIFKKQVSQEEKIVLPTIHYNMDLSSIRDIYKYKTDE